MPPNGGISTSGVNNTIIQSTLNFDKFVEAAKSREKGEIVFTKTGDAASVGAKEKRGILGWLFGGKRKPKAESLNFREAIKEKIAEDFNTVMKGAVEKSAINDKIGINAFMKDFELNDIRYQTDDGKMASPAAVIREKIFKELDKELLATHKPLSLRRVNIVNNKINEIMEREIGAMVNNRISLGGSGDKSAVEVALDRHYDSISDASSLIRDSKYNSRLDDRVVSSNNLLVAAEDYSFYSYKLQKSSITENINDVAAFLNNNTSFRDAAVTVLGKDKVEQLIKLGADAKNIASSISKPLGAAVEDRISRFGKSAETLYQIAQTASNLMERAKGARTAQEFKQLALDSQEDMVGMAKGLNELKDAVN